VSKETKPLFCFYFVRASSLFHHVDVKRESVAALSAEERDKTLNEQRIRTSATQTSGKYLMNHIAGVMDMVQDSDNTLDEETLAAIEAHVKSIAEELIHQAQEQRVGVLSKKKTPPLYMQRQRDPDNDERSR
jgi:hypothetical protein